MSGDVPERRPKPASAAREAAAEAPDQMPANGERGPAPGEVPTKCITARPSPDGCESTQQRAKSVRKQALVASIGCAATALLCLLLWNSTHALATELETRRTRASQLAADAHALTALRQRPREVSETGLPRSDLLECVNSAMRDAHLSPETLVSTLPQPPRSRPGAEHAEVVSRLLFESVSLEGLVRFCHRLATANPELHVAAIQLRAGSDRKTWDADVSVSYWIFSPTP